MKRVVGLDVGGTQVKGGWIEADELPDPDPGVLVERTRAIDTDLDRGVSDLLDRLAAFARELGLVDVLGVGVPGVFHPATGELLRSANMRAIEGVRLREELAARLDVGAIAVDNDANAAAFGEQWLGAGRDVDDLILVTLGTGVGGAVVLSGEVFRGPTGRGGEIGHLVVRSRDAGEPEDPGLRCGCGAYGCLERVASATAARRRARAAGLTEDLEELHRRATEGSETERALFHDVGRDLGAGLLSAVALLDVTTVLVGGGFGAALDVLRPGIEEVLAERDYGNDPVVVRRAELGEAAGWIGAARGAVSGR